MLIPNILKSRRNTKVEMVGENLKGCENEERRSQKEMETEQDKKDINGKTKKET